ncbi:dTDP-4-dehydrorhamnose reductase [Desulfocurvus vexinensis]|uniref:dTDP-4-dehydrorhamnose reductase n=1 Tax=Desulfocurvus vexinensis TaxID=399548 RepID=UPI00049094A5|nr:dTDP-4-dehydrorhamnose reductase [Desulfocurvus vexinensis]
MNANDADTRPAALVLGGRTGLLGMALCAALEAAGWRAEATARPEAGDFDLLRLAGLVRDCGARTVFNTWAHTQVDKAEDEPDEARRLNAVLPEIVGRACARAGAGLVHFSTDFVFGGKADTPRDEDDPPAPESVYGRTKLEGERALLALDPPGLLIVRTAWLFGPGKKNFVRTMLDLCRRNNCVSVVHDQVGSPTFTPDLARYTLALVDKGAQGLFHVVNSGEASWCELASEALRMAGVPCAVAPVTSAEYPQRAKRPAYSALSTARFTRATGLTPRPWVQAVRDYVLREVAPEA